MKPIARPVYLDLLRIHLPLPGWVSILHRVSGVLLFLAVPLGVWVLSRSLSDEAGFLRMLDWATRPPVNCCCCLRYGHSRIICVRVCDIWRSISTGA